MRTKVALGCFAVLALAIGCGGEPPSDPGPVGAPTTTGSGSSGTTTTGNTSVCPGGCREGLVCSDGQDGHARGSCWGCWHDASGDASCVAFESTKYPHFYQCVDSELPSQCVHPLPGTGGGAYRPCCP